MNLFQRFYEQHRGIVSGHVALTLITFPLEMLLLSYISGMIFQKIKDKKYKAFYIVLVGFFLAFLWIQFLHFAQDYMSSLIIPRLDTFTRTELLDAMLNHRFEEDELKVGELMHRISKTPGHLYKHYSNTVNYLIPLVFSAIFFAGYVFWIHWKMGLLVALSFLILYIAYFTVFFYLTRDAGARLDMEHGLMDSYEDTMANWESIRMAQTRQDEKDRMVQQSQDFETKQQNDIHKVNTLKIVSIIVFNLVMILLLAYGIYLSSQQKAFPYWKLIILITAIFLMSKTATNLLVKTSDSIYHAGSVDQFQQFLSRFTKGNVASPRSTSMPMSAHPVLALENVSYTYPGASQPILRDISIHIPFPSSILILGSIGSGKSTLVKMLLGFYPPTTGSLTIDGIPLDHYDPSDLLHHITYMNQSVLLFHRTLLENIFYGVPTDQEALEQVRDILPPRIMDHLEEKAGKQGQRLSGGERQIILLLRTYFKPHPVVLLDEPTANLDPESKHRAQQIIQRMMQKKTVICITHDPEMMTIFPRVYQLTEGVLVEKK